MSNDPAYKRRWYLRNRESILAKEAERYRTDSEFQTRKRNVAREWSRANRDRRNAVLRSRRARPEVSAKVRAYSRDYRTAFALRSHAHTCVSHAIRDGKLVRGTECQECGSQRFVIAHHDDYTRPLDVRWVCRACHHRIHEKDPAS